MPQVWGFNDADPSPVTPPIVIEYPHPGAGDSSSDSDSDLSDGARSPVLVIFYPSIDLASHDALGSLDNGMVLEAEPQYMELDPVTHIELLDTQITYRRRSVAVEEIRIAAEMARGVNCCAVCLEDYTEGERVSRLPCGHCFHKDCITRWFQTRVTCPICRFKLVQEAAGFY